MSAVIVLFTYSGLINLRNTIYHGFTDLIPIEISILQDFLCTK